MRNVNQWSDLQPFGIHVLTGEACGLSYRLLCDVTEQGKRVIEKCFDAKLQLAEAWNRDAVGSIMLTQEMLVPLGIFALLESGCREVWRNGTSLVGIEEDDGQECVRLLREDGFRRYAYDGTAGSRNRHVMTGRVL